MRFLIQRVKQSSVEVDNKIVGKIDKGFLVFIGITHKDSKLEADYLIKKLLNLRIFEDENGKMNLNINQVNGELLLISQFTLYADTVKSGNRPSFTDAAKPDYANELYEYIIEELKKTNIKVQTGIFGADMQISLINDGPVTIMLEK
ncbi:MAG: D-aminoacyl-tRNA deacylase [Candidatus Scatovivens sp.]